MSDFGERAIGEWQTSHVAEDKRTPHASRSLLARGFDTDPRNASTKVLEEPTLTAPDVENRTV